MLSLPPKDLAWAGGRLGLRDPGGQLSEHSRSKGITLKIKVGYTARFLNTGVVAASRIPALGSAL